MASICDDTSSYMLPFYQSYYGETTEFGTCGGHGVCESGLFCVCDDNWTGRSDFIDTQGITCNVFEPAIKFIWALNTAMILFYSFRTRNDFRSKRQQHLDMVLQKAQQGKHYSVRDNKGYAAILLLAFGCFPFTIALGMLRIGKEDERVGHTWAITILFALAKLTFYSSVYLYQPQLLATIGRGGKNMFVIVSLAKTWGFVNLVLSVALGFLPFVTLLGSENGRDEVAQAVYVVYFAGSVLSMLTLGVQAFTIERKFLQIVAAQEAASGKSDRTEEIKQRLFLLQHEAKVQAAVQGSVYMVFLFYPFLQAGGHDYLLGISWLAFPVLYRKMVTSTVTARRVGDSTGTGSYSKGSKDDSKDASHSHSYRGPGGSTYVESSPGSRGAARQPSTTTLPLSTTRNFQEKATSFHDPDGDAAEGDPGYV